MVLAFLAIRSGPASAQGHEPPDPAGFTFGVGLGAAVVSLSSVPGTSTPVGPNLALAWRLGYRFSNEFAIVLNAGSAVCEYEGTGRPRKRGFEGLFPSVQYWPTPRLWFSAGAGLNLDAPAFYDIDDASERSFHFGPGAVALVGYEVHRTHQVGIEILARAHGGYSEVPAGRQYGTSASLLLGISP